MNSFWKNTDIDLGPVKQGSSTKFEYELLEPVEIRLIKPGCGGCTKTKLKDNILNVTFKAGNIPSHLARKQDFQYVTKFITIMYTNGSKEILKFRAKIEK